MRWTIKLTLKSKHLIFFAVVIFGIPRAESSGRKPEAAESPVEVVEEALPAGAAQSMLIDVEVLPGFSPPAPEAASPPVKPIIEKVWIWQETNDCLWNMAKEHYGDPFLWPRIYEANRHLIRDPHVIFPKQQIVIPPSVTARAYARPEPPVVVPVVPPVRAVEPEPVPGEEPALVPVDVLDEQPAVDERSLSGW